MQVPIIERLLDKFFRLYVTIQLIDTITLDQYFGLFQLKIRYIFFLLVNF